MTLLLMGISRVNTNDTKTGDFRPMKPMSYINRLHTTHKLIADIYLHLFPASTKFMRLESNSPGVH